MSAEHNHSESRDRAASESAWVAEQEALARKFGVDPPAIVKEALVRLGGLARVVLDETPGLGATLDAKDRVSELERLLREQTEQTDAVRIEARAYLQAIRKEADDAIAEIGECKEASHACDVDAKVKPVPEIAERKPIALAHGLVIRSIANGARVVFTEPKEGRWEAQTILVNGGLGEPTPTGQGKWFDDVWIVVGETEARGIAPRIPAHWSTVPVKPPATVAEVTGAKAAPLSKEGPAPSPLDAPGGPGARGPFDGALSHGLVLVNAETGERRLFSESVKGSFQVQTVAPDGATAGEPWSTKAAAWPSPWLVYWGEIGAKPALPRYDAPRPAKAKPVQVTIEGSGPAASAASDTPAEKPASAADNRKRIGDFSLAPETAEKYASDWKVDVAQVMATFVEWQAANADKMVPNPGLAFWHAGGRKLKPAE